MAASPVERVTLERLPHWAWAVIAVLALSVVCAILQIGFVRPYLWPAGAGARLAGDPASRIPLTARPADIRTELHGPPTVTEVHPGSPAAMNGIQPADVVVAQRRLDAGSPAAALEISGPTTPAQRIALWRGMYWEGVSGPVQWTVSGGSGSTRDVTLDRPSAWRADTSGWAARHLGLIVQTLVFVGGAVLLFMLRSSDATAALCVLALAFSAVAGGGPLLASERIFGPAAAVLTIFSWIAAPLAFPMIALAIVYFPSRSALVERHRWIVALPLIAAAPMIVPSLMTALYLTGVAAAERMAIWDATHPRVYFASFAAALAVNVAAVVEGTYRYRFNHNANERRRIRMALYTAVPGILAYAIKEGVPITAAAAGLPAPHYPVPVIVFLQALVLLPAFGLVYAIGVAHVLGPRVVLRRSLQYALANRGLTVLTVLPVAALIVSLAANRDKTLSQIASSSSGIFIVLVGAAIVMWRYKERARQWLDQRFFREEYDARKILLSLSSRVRFETDPVDLANMVVGELDQALHPQMAAVLVANEETGTLAAVASLHGAVEPLPMQGGIVSMLRWSDEPLEIYLSDARSPARRLPTEERRWLQATGSVLLVPISGEDHSLVGIIALAERRSEEAYTADDRQLLASIATQMAFCFDVARLRRRGAAKTDDADRTGAMTVAFPPMMECPKCGRCEETSVARCPADNSLMQSVPSVPRLIDNKYRIEQLLGRGGMGGVYRARDMRLDRLVAVKVVRAELMGDPEARRRFRREAQIIARLQHPSIVSIYDYGTFPHGGAYLVMELVRGEDLRRVLQKEGRLDPRQAMRILGSVCDAIEAAHRGGVLHRDLKPENILLPGDGEAKVLDFGVAKVVTDDAPAPDMLQTSDQSLLTTAGMIIGTPAYMAPEQFHGAPLDGRTDVFSLGVVAYEMLTGELPFGRGSLGEVILAHARGAPSMKAMNISPATERAIRVALDMNPDRRPPSPQAFAHLLSSSLDLR
jgi:tRNA A-37 threonylcarbamoyl transferase component Bud32